MIFKGDLVRAGDPTSPPGIVIKVDREYYGANQAFKIYKKVERGMCILPGMVDGIGPTRLGIRDRVLVFWPDHGYSYEPSDVLEVVSEAG